MDSFTELAGARRSCRKFAAGGVVDRRQMEQIMRAATLSPSAGNSQPWRYVAVDDPHRVSQLAACVADGENSFCSDASAFVVVMEDKRDFKTNLQYQKFMGIDIGLSVAHLLLAAADLGIASFIIGSFNERKLKTLLGIPKTRRIKLVVALGREAGDVEPGQKHRRPFEQTVTYNKF